MKRSDGFPRILSAVTGIGGVFLALAAPAPVAVAAQAEYLPICTLPKCLNPRVTTKAGVGTDKATAEASIAPEDAEKWCAQYKPRDKYCAKEQVKTGWIGFRGLYKASADCAAGKMTAIDGGTYTYAGLWEDGAGKGRARFTPPGQRVPLAKWDETGVKVDGTGEMTGWGGGSPNLATQWEVLCAGAPAPAVK